MKLKDIILEISQNILNDALKFFKSELKLNNANILLINTANKSYLGAVSFPKNHTYKININFDDTKFGFIKRLAHEMIHIQQMELNKLIFIDNNTISYNGIQYNNIDYNKNYHEKEFPFEIEAFTMEKVLSNKFWKKYQQYI
jgi:hypothetical protein